jgi:hypothetical protein
MCETYKGTLWASAGFLNVKADDTLLTNEILKTDLDRCNKSTYGNEKPLYDFRRKSLQKRWL